MLHYGDLTDSTNLIRIIQQVQPDEIYNLGAQSHVAVSFESPEYTANSDALVPCGSGGCADSGALCQNTDLSGEHQRALWTSAGDTSENTPFYPRSPYGVAKLYAYWITVNTARAKGCMPAMEFLNHESPRRGGTFVTRKITRGLARVDAGLDDCLYMGNLNSMRDWGHARDYVEMVADAAAGAARGFRDSHRTPGCAAIELTAQQLGWGYALGG